MKTSNLPSGALRTAECGHIYEEKLSNAAGTLELPRCAPFRVRAVAGGTVTIDGVLAMTMVANEVVIFNTGDGVPTLNKSTVTVVFSAAVYCQVARTVERPQPSIA
jgi:hypothetical protein